MIRSTDDYWVKDSRFVSLSDLGLITKEGRDKIYVFANSIKTAEPMNAVNVAVYSVNNQLIGTAITDKDGMAAISFSNKEFSGFKPAMVIAKTEDDFNYMPFSNTRVNTSRFDVGGKRNNAAGFDAYVYAERDVYRPGEKINFSVILRDAAWKSPGDIPLRIKFLLPNGKELKTIRKTLNGKARWKAVWILRFPPSQVHIPWKCTRRMKCCSLLKLFQWKSLFRIVSALKLNSIENFFVPAKKETSASMP